MYGYKGRILVCDLDLDKTLDLPIDTKTASLFLGGSGYSASLLGSLIDSKTEPLGPENVLLIMTGPLTGTLAPCTGRHVICSRSPLTGIWGESHSGGHFGANLKFAGYDGVLVRGRASSPVLLTIVDGKASILPATDLWGRTTSETQVMINEEHGRMHTACIGPAGENLVRYSSIVNGERVAARCGLGAVMGSKNLKAVAVRGIDRVEISMPDRFQELARRSSRTLGEAMSMLNAQGTAMYVDIGMMFNDMPIKYFQEIEFDEADLINAKAMDEILVGRTACYSCPIGCGRKVSVPEHSLVGVAGPEYQTLASFGSNLLVSDLRKLAVMNRLCNEYGLDTISCGSTIALSTHLAETGLADFDLSWGDPDAVIEMIHMIAGRRGIGNLLAEGSLIVARTHNCEEKVLHVRGLEIPNHDPRAFSGMATVYTVAARGATHLEGDMYSVDMGADVRQLGIVGGDRLENESKGEVAARAQDFRAFCDSVILCHFAIVPPENIISLLNLALGTSYRIEDILVIGARAVTMKRLLNLRLGLRTSDERLPPSLLQPQPESVTDDFVPDVDMQLNEYYAFRDWDRDSGKPSEAALRRLGLD